MEGSDYILDVMQKKIYRQNLEPGFEDRETEGGQVKGLCDKYAAEKRDILILF